MASARFRVAFAGPHVSVQDAGRFGYLRFGVPASGPMDRRSHAIANIALAMPAEAAAIEISMGGLSLECLSGAVTFAVVGGGFIVECGGATGGSWSVRTIRAGEKLAIRPGPWGSWSYLAFAGRLVSGRWLGHAATHSMSGLGGGKLVAGQELKVEDAAVIERREGDIPCPVFARPRHDIHVVMGPQDRHFEKGTIETFLSKPFVLTDAYDRMGVRLKGPPLMPEAALSIPSEPILRGSIQVAGDGAATILLADHQTMGGYPKIATVLSDDLDGLVQLRPRDGIRFRAISPEGAVALARQRAVHRRPYFDAIGRPRGRLAQRLMRENLIGGAISGQERDPAPSDPSVPADGGGEKQGEARSCVS